MLLVPIIIASILTILLFTHVRGGIVEHRNVSFLIAYGSLCAQNIWTAFKMWHMATSTCETIAVFNTTVMHSCILHAAMYSIYNENSLTTRRAYKYVTCTVCVYYIVATSAVMQKKPTIVFIDYYLEVEGQKYTTGDHIARELVKLGYTGRIILRSANLIQSEFDFIDKATENLYDIVTNNCKQTNDTNKQVSPLRSFFVSEMRKRVVSLSMTKSSSVQLSILHKMKGSAGVFASTDAVQGTKMRSYISEQYESYKKSACLLCKNDIDALHCLLNEIENE